MNLFLSMETAFAAPIIMMSQNRQALRDRLVLFFQIGLIGLVMILFGSHCIALQPISRTSWHSLPRNGYRHRVSSTAGQLNRQQPFDHCSRPILPARC
jgi:Protein of unknown function (DUF1003)